MQRTEERSNLIHILIDISHACIPSLSFISNMELSLEYSIWKNRNTITWCTQRIFNYLHKKKQFVWCICIPLNIPEPWHPCCRSRSWTETNRVWGDDYLKQEAERFTNSQCVSCQYLLNTDQQMIAGQECACLSHVWRHLLRKTSPNEPGLDKPGPSHPDYLSLIYWVNAFFEIILCYENSCWLLQKTFT